MQGFARLVAVLLLVPFSSAMFATREFATSAMGAEHPAECHEPMPVPAPAPVSYQCCVMGHHWAAPGTVFSVRLRLLPPRPGDSEPNFSPSLLADEHTAGLVAPSTSPPQPVPLRI